MNDWTLPSWFAPVGFWAAFAGVVGILIRQIGPWRKQVTDEERDFRAELTRANANLRARIEKMEARLSRQQARHSAERALDRHRLNNVTQCFDAMLLLIEMNPDRGKEIVTKIKAMRAAQVVAEAEEKAIISAAEIAAGEDDYEPHGAEETADRAVSKARETVKAAIATQSAVSDMAAEEGK